LVPFLAIGACAAANAILIGTVARVRPEPVRDQPYLASMRHDEESQARQRFAASGARLVAEPSAGGIHLRLDPCGAGLTDVVIECYRPADRAADREMAWSDAGRALDLPLAAAGRWQLQLRGRYAGQEVLTTIDAEAGRLAP
jgi:hypothetical protein